MRIEIWNVRTLDLSHIDNDRPLLAGDQEGGYRAHSEADRSGQNASIANTRRAEPTIQRDLARARDTSLRMEGRSQQYALVNERVELR